MMKFKKEWENFEHENKEVINVFRRWKTFNIEVISGGDLSVEKTFGLPYTSSSEFAMIGNTNCIAVYRYNPEWHFDALALSESNDVVAIFSRDTENGEEDMYIIIGKIM